MDMECVFSLLLELRVRTKAPSFLIYSFLSILTCSRRVSSRKVINLLKDAAVKYVVEGSPKLVSKINIAALAKGIQNPNHLFFERFHILHAVRFPPLRHHLCRSQPMLPVSI